MTQNIIQTLTATLFSIHDFSMELKKLGAQPISQVEAPRANDAGFGIFHSVQKFRRGIRRKEHLEQIRYWAVDLDEGTKSEQIERINRGLTPSFVVETKNGFHCYWKAEDADEASWSEIMTDRLVPYYKADRNAKDLCRILRTPGFFHQKIKGDKFMVKAIFESDKSYTQSIMKFFYPDANAFAKQALSKKMKLDLGEVPDGLWEFIYRIDCMDALAKISGMVEVRGESFGFKSNARGTSNILVDGKSTSAWVDRDGRIGSSDGGGPTIYNWITWYGTPAKEALRLIREVYPECPQN